MHSPEIKSLIQYLSKIPGLGPRSARRAVLHLIKHKEQLTRPLAASLQEVADKILTCSICGNIDTASPCHICQDTHRDHCVLCVVESVSDLWAIERTKNFKGLYHILGGTLSPLEGITAQDLNFDGLLARLAMPNTPIQELIIALNATVTGQTTSHYLMDLIADYPIKVTRLAHGVPIGGELDYLDEGTLSAALSARRAVL